MCVKLWAENVGKLPWKQTFPARQQLGPCLSGLIWQQQIVFMAGPQPSIRSVTEDQLDSSRGHIVTTETAFESGNINNIGRWHETKRKRRKDG